MVYFTGEGLFGDFCTLLDKSGVEEQRFGGFLEARSHQSAADTERAKTYVVRQRSLKSAALGNSAHCCLHGRPMARQRSVCVKASTGSRGARRQRSSVDR